MVQSVNRDAYREQIHALLPAGRAWPEEADTTLDALVRAMASQVAEVDRSASNLLTDILPNTTFNLLARMGAGGRPAGHLFGAGPRRSRFGAPRCWKSWSPSRTST